MMAPKRIISLVPSLTELMFALGRGDMLAGRTRFCIHPGDRIENVPVIGGTKNPRIDKIRSIEPDLVIANREENRKEDVKALQEFCEVMVTDIPTVDASLNEIRRIGDAVDAADESGKLIRRIKDVIPPPDAFPTLWALYLIWREPWMAAGNDTYIHDVMQLFGLQNVCSSLPRYPELIIADIRELEPEIILLSSEPYPFRAKHAEELEGLCPQSRTMLVDGEWFSWYGPRMIPSFSALAAWRQNL